MRRFASLFPSVCVCVWPGVHGRTCARCLAWVCVCGLLWCWCRGGVDCHAGIHKPATRAAARGRCEKYALVVDTYKAPTASLPFGDNTRSHPRPLWRNLRQGERARPLETRPRVSAHHALARALGPGGDRGPVSHADGQAKRRRHGGELYAPQREHQVALRAVRIGDRARLALADANLALRRVAAVVGVVAAGAVEAEAS